MKHLKQLLVMAIVIILVGCAAGINFKKMEENQLMLGKTTRDEVVMFMGNPNGKGTKTLNGIEVEFISYAYASTRAAAALPGVTPARAQMLYFRDGVLVGKEYTSSFADDSTLFDVEKAKSISKGQTEADVIATMGPVKGEYIYPMVDDETGHAIVYIFRQTKGFKSKADVFVVEFNEDNIVTSTKLSSQGQL